MNKFFSHLRTVRKHRNFVREYCFKAVYFGRSLDFKDQLKEKYYNELREV